MTFTVLVVSAIAPIAITATAPIITINFFIFCLHPFPHLLLACCHSRRGNQVQRASPNSSDIGGGGRNRHLLRRVPEADDSGARGAPALPFPRGKSNTRPRGGFARPSTEQMDYSKKPLQAARAGFLKSRQPESAVGVKLDLTTVGKHPEGGDLPPVDKSLALFVEKLLSLFRAKHE